MNRIIGPLVVLVLLASLFVPLGSPQDAQTEVGPEDAPWWDDGRNVGVDRFREGWNLRIPLEVRDNRDHREGAPVQVHLDLARSLIEGGWPERGGRPLSFMAYPEAVRLVAYEDWGEFKGEVAFRQHTTWLEPDQRDSQYDKQQTSPFHGQRNPVVTLEWRLPEGLAAGETHRYMVYFDIENNAGVDKQHRKQDPQFDAQDIERLDSLYWVGAGNTVYGSNHHIGNPNTLLVIATQDDTNVRIYTYPKDKLTASLDEGAGDEPTFVLQNAGDRRAYSFGFQPDTPFHFRVEADKPVVVMTHPPGETAPMMAPNFVPSREGDLLGWTFDVPEAAHAIYLIRPPGDQEEITFVAFPDTGVNVPANCLSGGNIRLTSLNDEQNPSEPRVTYCRIGFNNPSRTTIQTFSVVEGPPILVQFSPHASIHSPIQVPSALGSPVGSVFHASTVSGSVCNDSSRSGGFDVTAWEDAAVNLLGRFLDGGPHNPLDETVAVNVDSSPVHLDGSRLRMNNCPDSGSQFPRDTWPYSVEVVADEDGGPTGPVQVRLAPSDPGVQSTPYGGRHGMDFKLQGHVLVHSFYPETRVTITHRDGDMETRNFDLAGVPRAFNLGNDAVVSLQADKPVSVFPSEAPPGNYARFHAALPGFLEPKILPGQYRGYVFEAGSLDGTDPVFRTGLPNEELTIPFTVRNLAQWDADPLQDTIHLSANVQSDWERSATVGTAFDQTAMHLTDHSAQNNRLTIELPDDVPADTQLTIRVRAESEGNEQMTQDFNIIVLVRQTFGVEMWFGEPTSLSGIQNKEIGIEEDTTESVPFVIRNTGSNIDTFNLELGHPGGGWDTRITDTAGQTLTRAEDLEPGNQRAGILHVRAPLAPHIPSVIIPISAVSTTSPLASDLITLTADIAMEQDMRLSAEERTRSISPGATERFDVTLSNTGESGLSVRMGLDATLPPGWTVAFAGMGHPQKPPIALGPGQEVVIPIDVTAAEDAAADDFVSFLLSAEAGGTGADARAVISLAARVDRAHHLEVAPLEELTLRPGQATPLTVEVTNLGNTVDEVTIEPVALPGGWLLEEGNVTHEVPAGQSVSIPLGLTARAHEAPGTFALLLQARSLGPAFPFPVPVEVATVHELAWQEPGGVLVQPGEHQRTSLRLENQGNVLERVSLEASGPGGWGVRLDPNTVEIPPGSTRTVFVEWEVPTGAVTGDESVQLSARTQSGDTTQVTLPVGVEAARLELENLVVTSAPRRAGDVGTVIALLHNPGDVPVKNVQARLLGQEDEQGATVVVARVEFDSVGAHGTVVAPLRWVEGEDPRVGQVVWGMMRDGVFMEFGSAPLPEAEGDDVEERVGLPLPSVVVGVILALGLVSLLRRAGKGDRV